LGSDAVLGFIGEGQFATNPMEAGFVASDSMLDPGALGTCDGKTTDSVMEGHRWLDTHELGDPSGRFPFDAKCA
jgi:hypothetical protein